VTYVGQSVPGAVHPHAGPAAAGPACGCTAPGTDCPTYVTGRESTADGE